MERLKTILLFSIVIFLFQCSDHKKPAIQLDAEEMTLSNGLKTIFVKNEGPPIFSANIRFRVGSIEEPEGYSGLAHFFEHMAFKGTPEIGVRDYEKERKILDQIHEVGTQLTQLKLNHAKNQDQNIFKLETKLKELQQEHQNLLIKNEFVQIYQRNGGANINATTSNDYTTYYVSLPSNKLELWAKLESERIKKPVLRDFFKERDVVAEERRMRYDNQPTGKLFEAYLKTSFDKSPYRLGAIGEADEIQAYTPQVAREFYRKNYIPSRMVISIVGNYDREKAKKYVEDYFGTLSNHEVEEELKTHQPHIGEGYPRVVSIKEKAEPRFYVGFHRLAHPHPDDEVFDVIKGLICDGRTSKLYKKLVLEEKIASQIGCSTSLPGTRLNGMFSIYAVPLAPHTNKELHQAVLNVLEDFKNSPVTDQELLKVRNSIQADLIYSLESNSELASMLTFFESLSGSWAYIYRLPQRISEIDQDDVMDVAREYFVPDKRVTVFLEKEDNQ